MFEAIFQIMRNGTTLELIITSYQLLIELEKVIKFLILFYFLLYCPIFFLSFQIPKQVYDFDKFVIWCLSVCVFPT